MRITKIGHCCLLIETKSVRILTDPGNFSTGQKDLKGIDAVLITHEHGDHLHTESLQEVLQNNPDAVIITNSAVGKILEPLDISFQLVAHGDSTAIKEVSIEGFGKEHADIYKTILPVENTGYFIDEKLFYPGDSFFNPQKEIDVLALPVAGPWMKISEAMDYAIFLKPKRAFPVHDGMYKDELAGNFHFVPSKFLPEAGIEFVSMKAGDSHEF